MSTFIQPRRPVRSYTIHQLFDEVFVHFTELIGILEAFLTKNSSVEYFEDMPADYISSCVKDRFEYAVWWTCKFAKRADFKVLAAEITADNLFSKNLDIIQYFIDNDPSLDFNGRRPQIIAYINKVREVDSKLWKDCQSGIKTPISTVLWHSRAFRYIVALSYVYGVYSLSDNLTEHIYNAHNMVDSHNKEFAKELNAAVTEPGSADI